MPEAEQVTQALITAGGQQQADVIRADQRGDSWRRTIAREGERPGQLAGQQGHRPGVGRAGGPDLDRRLAHGCALATGAATLGLDHRAGVAGQQLLRNLAEDVPGSRRSRRSRRGEGEDPGDVEAVACEAGGMAVPGTAGSDEASAGMCDDPSRSARHRGSRSRRRGQPGFLALREGRGDRQPETVTETRDRLVSPVRAPPRPGARGTASAGLRESAGSPASPPGVLPGGVEEGDERTRALPSPWHQGMRVLGAQVVDSAGVRRATSRGRRADGSASRHGG